MKETDMVRGSNKRVKSLPSKPNNIGGKLPEKNSGRKLNAKDKNSGSGPSSDKLANRRTSAETQVAFEHMALAHVSEEGNDGTVDTNNGQDNPKPDNHSSDMEIVDESDGENTNGSVSSRRVFPTDDDQQRVEIYKDHSFNADPPVGKATSDLKQEEKLNVTSTLIAKSLSNGVKNVHLHPNDLSELSTRQYVDSEKVAEISTDEDAVDSDTAVDAKILELETKITNLESELREVAALEFALYSVVPEHGSSAYKVYKSARHLSRLYIHACKYWTQDKRASVARNTVSGLVLVSKSCGSDVSRLIFWLSNAVVLREILSQTFGNSCGSRPPEDASQSNDLETKISDVNLKDENRNINQNIQSFVQFADEWQETRTFTAALERVESWIFSRMVELIWWQILTPKMQSPVGGSTTDNLWKNAFLDAYKRLCPLRGGGHECGCLPLLARKVLEQCIGRLDVAMFNALLRESAHEMPTDPVSDPILDSEVLPIPAGDLSFGSGAQLKNTVGNWSIWLSNSLGMDFDISQRNHNEIEGDNQKGLEGSKTFPLLNELSDLLMLPKDLLLDSAVRMEVCPLISIPLVKRVLCNFSPDEFCPDPVPGAVLEALNTEWCTMDHTLPGDSSKSFPYTASPIVYTPPSSLDVSDKIADADASNTTPRLSQSASFIHRKGYTSDEELDELESCFRTVVGSADAAGPDRGSSNVRYDLLRDVWKAA